MEGNHLLSLQLKSSTAHSSPPEQSTNEATAVAVIKAYPYLRSVRKPSTKPRRKLEPPAPAVKAYQVEPREFRRVVQRLTGKTRCNPRPMRDTVAPPPPLELAPRSIMPPQLQPQPQPQQSAFDHHLSPMGLLSPGLFFSSWLLSPKTAAALES